MGLDEIRDRARAQIHEQFSLPAVVRSPDGRVEVPVNARMHLNIRKPFGDLDREGFAMVIEEASGIVIDRQEWEPQRGWSIDFGRDRVFTLDVSGDTKAERYARVQVTYGR